MMLRLNETANYSPGELVFKRVMHFDVGQNRKLDAAYIGPLRIRSIDEIGYNVILEDPISRKLVTKAPVNVTQIKKAYLRDETLKSLGISLPIVLPIDSSVEQIQSTVECPELSTTNSADI